MDPERQLALAYVPAARRAAVEALWRLDVALGSVLATGSDPMISRIRLAWWRESLEKLDQARPPAEPVLEAVAEHVLAAGVKGGELAAMGEGWEALLSPGPLGSDMLDLYARARGGRLFEYSARLLGHDAEEVAEGGEAWALVDLARRVGSEVEIVAALAAARTRTVRNRWPAPLRPIGMLATLALRDAVRGPKLARQGSPGRMARMLGHRFTGR